MTLRILLLIAGFFIHFDAFAGSAIEFGGVNVSVSSDETPDKENIAQSIQVLVLMTLLSLAPAMVVMLTSFTRIIIVLAMLRHAFGMQQTPPNVVIISLALFLTVFTMMPVLEKIDENAFTPYTEGELDLKAAGYAAMDPLREFMIRQTSEKDLALMIEISRQEQPETMADIKNTTLIPAFMLSELQTAFKIGFVIFLPFLVIDLIVASVLMSMGMIMLPPMSISLPIKILMFVLIEGWALVAQALVNSFY